MAAGGSAKVVLATFFANLGIAIAKFVGFIFIRSPMYIEPDIVREPSPASDKSGH